MNNFRFEAPQGDSAVTAQLSGIDTSPVLIQIGSSFRLILTVGLAEEIVDTLIELLEEISLSTAR